MQNPSVHLLLKISGKIPPLIFIRLCLLLAALQLLIIYPAFYWLAPHHLPNEMRPEKGHLDFVQYYDGAVVVQKHLWSSLYPTPKSNLYIGTSPFKPLYRTFLFDDQTIEGNLAFYPDIKNVPMASEVSPQLIRYFPEADSSFRYIYPPPTALLLGFLSCSSFEFSASKIWPTMGVASYFLMVFFSSRIHRLLRGYPSYAEGLVVIASLLFIFRGRTDLSTGNVTPLLSGLVAAAVYALMKNRPLLFCCAWIPIFLFKTLGLAWIPLLLLSRKFWTCFLGVAILSLVLNGITLFLGGPAVYENFFLLSPYIVIPGGVGILATLLKWFGFYPRFIYLALNVGGLGLLYYGYWRRLHRGFLCTVEEQTMPYVAALMAGTFCLYCLLNFNMWYTYCPNYFFFPFLGWILWEGVVASGPWRVVVLAGTSVSFIVFAGEWMIQGALFHLSGSRGVSLFHDAIYHPASVFLVPLFFFVVATRRLYADQMDRVPKGAPL